MKKHLFAYCLLLLLFVVGCTQEKEFEYYENGTIKSETVKIEATRYKVTRFYSNGNKSEEGEYYNKLKEGEWAQWYINGTERWRGIYLHNVKQYNDDDGLLGSDCELEYDSKLDYISKGVPTPIRLRIKGVNPFDISAIEVINGVSKRAENNELYDFEITPFKAGVLKMTVEIRINSGKKKGTVKRLCEITVPVQD